MKELRSELEGQESDAELRADLQRAAELVEIAVKSRRGVIDGVEIDLQHSEIDPAVWTPVCSLGASSPWTPDSQWPFLVFPWTGPAERRRSRLYDESRWVRSGDRVFIERVRPITGGYVDVFTGVNETLGAFLTIQRGNGTLVRTDRPLAFRRSFAPSKFLQPTQVGYAILLDRAQAALRPRLFDDILGSAPEVGLFERAVASAGAVAELSSMLFPNIDQATDPQSDHDQEVLRRLIDEAVSFGYLSAQADTVRYVTEPAALEASRASVRARAAIQAEARVRRRLERRSGGSKLGGRRSGKSRQDKGARWRAIVGDLLAAMPTDPHEVKRESLDLYLNSKWPSRQLAPPKRSTMLKILVEFLGPAPGRRKLSS